MPPKSTADWWLPMSLQLALCLAAVQALFAFTVEASADQTSGGALPTYRLKVGRELVYNLTRQQSFSSTDLAADKQSDTPRDQMKWRVIVVAKNNDNSWRLLIRSKIAFNNADGSVRAKRNSLGYCDLHPNGSYSLDEQTAIVKRLIPYELFCRLPDSEAELSDGWRFKAPVINYGYQLRAEDRSGPVLRIAGIEDSIYSKMHQWEQSRVYTFDLDRGLVTSITSDFRDTEADKLKDRRVVELISDESHDAEQMAKLREETDRYLDDYRKWIALAYVGARAHSVADCKTARATARAVLETGRKQATVEMVRESYDSELQQHDKDDRGETEMAQKRSQFFALAPSFATDWQAKDLDGGTFRLADHRGKPVVLFFWGTNCEYCVLMGPQLQQLAAEFKNKGALILGMFVRRVGMPLEEEDGQAKFLVDVAYQGFTHLDGTGIEKQYRLAELHLGHPSLVILDQAGKPHEVQLGYSADTIERMRTVLNELLSQPSDRE